MRRLLGNIFRSQEDFEVAFARDGVEALAKLPGLPTRCSDPRRAHAKHGWLEPA